MEFYKQKRRFLPPRSLLSKATPQVFVHAERKVCENIAADKMDFFRHVETVANRRNVACNVVRHLPINRSELRDSHHLNILMGGLPAYGRSILHACPTYVPGFWYFDELGERESSSIALQTFLPRMIAEDRAKAFADRVRKQVLGNARTKWPQPDRDVTALDKGSIVVFAQELRPGHRQTVYMETAPMLEAVISAAKGRRVYIKPHPLQREEQLKMVRSFHAPDRGVHVVDANLFDLLEAAAFTISIGSAACFEGFLLGKPAILTGRTDFHHNTLTARSASELCDCIDRIETTTFHHDRFLTWFLRDCCINPRVPEALGRIEARIVQKGFWPPREP